ncbi:hypothetical protein JCM6882_008265 [Rhodosporidiobolus microsporus]
MPRDLLAPIPFRQFNSLLDHLDSLCARRHTPQATETDVALGFLVAGLRRYFPDEPAGEAEWARWQLPIPERQHTPNPCSFQHLLDYHLEMIKQGLTHPDPQNAVRKWRIRDDYKKFLEWQREITNHLGPSVATPRIPSLPPTPQAFPPPPSILPSSRGPAPEGHADGFGQWVPRR